MKSAEKLQRFVIRAVTKFGSDIDDVCDRCKKSFTKISTSPLNSSTAEKLRNAVAQHVHEARVLGLTRGVDDVLSELKIAAPQARVNLSGGAPPRRADVEQYVSNVVDYTMAKANEAKASGGGWEQAIVDASHRAELLIEDQGFRAYEASRYSAFSDLYALADDPKRGFVVARSTSELRHVREDTKKSIVPVLAKRRTEVLDARTCSACRGQDGELALLVQEFAQPIPAHPRCRGASHMWGVAWPWSPEEKKMPNSEQMLRRWFSNERALEVDEKARTIKNVVVSDESLDSHGTIIKADGWDLSRFLKNPILLWAHDSGGGFERPKASSILGRAENVRVDGPLLVADFVFLPEGEDEEVDKVFRRIVLKFLRGVSVGFRPLAWHEEKFEGQSDTTIVFDKQLLTEISIVPVGSNENALMKEFLASNRAHDCSHYASETAATPQENSTMGQQETKSVALPPELAALMNVAEISDAVRKYSELTLKVDELEKRAVKAEESAQAAQKALNDRVEAEITREVDELVKAGRVADDKRTAALALARCDIAAFRDLYPPMVVAPAAHLLERVVRQTSAENAPSKDNEENPIMKRVAELQKEGLPYDQSFMRAVYEYQNNAA